MCFLTPSIQVFLCPFFLKKEMQEALSSMESFPKRDEGPSSVISPPSSVASSKGFRQRPVEVTGASNDPQYKDQLYRRLDEGIAATIVNARRWDSPADGKAFNGKEEKIHSSIFEKYRDNLAGCGIGSSDTSGSGGYTSNTEKGREKDQKYLNIRSTVIENTRAKVGTPATPPPDTKSSSSSTPTDANLLSSDAARFMDHTMAQSPYHQLVQLRVLELFQSWISSADVSKEIQKLLHDATHSPSQSEQDGADKPKEEGGLTQTKNGGARRTASSRGTLLGSSSATQDTGVEEERQEVHVQVTIEPTPPSVSKNSRGVPPRESKLMGSAGGRAEKSRPSASYEDIPRFYFPLGKPTTRERVISEPLYQHHENPHLKPPKDIPMVMVDSPSSSSTSLHSATSSSTAGKSSGKGNSNSNSIPSMSTLRLVDDRHVSSAIKKEFTRLGSSSRHPKGRLNASYRRSASTSRDTTQRHFHQCMQRICSQCFGVPRYFGFILIGLIQAELSSSGAHPNLSGSGGGGSKGGLPFISPHIYGIITADHVQDFYEKYLQNKDPLRRTFDLLVLSSRLKVTDDGQSVGLADASSLRVHLIREDFTAYLLTLLHHHPGLGFLRQTPDFQNKYLDTVIYRIFYEVDRFDHGRISFSEFITSRMMDAFREVDATDDINSVLLFFSYEHFYVLYCRFWELDTDRDMLLSPQDLMRYAPDDLMNSLVVERVFEGAGRRLRCSVKNRMGYEDFVWFCLSEEDKSTAPAIRYWFKVLDLDEDGVLSVFEMKTFFDITTSKAAQYLQDAAVTFENAICQVFDMLRCGEYRWLKLCDLLSQPVASYVALNMLTSMIKFLQFEYRDPFVCHQERLAASTEQSPWDRFARVEYDRMAQEGDE